MRRAALAPLLAAAWGLLAPVVGAQVRQVIVQARSAVDGSALGYAVVAVPALGIERLTGASGAVVVAAPPGALRISVKRLGFEPRDTVVTITEAVGQRIDVALRRLSLRLGEVRVEAWPACTAPGVPDRTAQPEAFHVVEQLRQNAERNELLLRAYPFVYLSERMLSYRDGDAPEEVTERVDTLLLAGDPLWRYAPGNLIERRSAGLILSRASYAMRLPSLRDLASPAFLANHCFHVAGIEEKAGQRLLRMDIVAADRLREPDVNVAVWLETADFRIRFSSMVLTRIPRQLGHLRQVTSEVTYLDLLPYVPVMYFTLGENAERGDAATARRWIERQQVLDVRYLGPRPDSTGADTAATRPPTH